MIVCPSCEAKNRVPAARLLDAPVCGRCRTALPLPGEPVALDDEASFDALVGRATVPVVVDFWAAWCGPCRAYAPTVSALAEKAGGRALVAKVDVDAVPRLAARFGIQGIPTTIVFRGGEVAARESGALSLGALERLVA